MVLQNAAPPAESAAASRLHEPLLRLFVPRHLLQSSPRATSLPAISQPPAASRWCSRRSSSRPAGRVAGPAAPRASRCSAPPSPRRTSTSAIKGLANAPKKANYHNEEDFVSSNHRCCAERRWGHWGGDPGRRAARRPDSACCSMAGAGPPAQSCHPSAWLLRFPWLPPAHSFSCPSPIPCTGC